MNNSKMVARYVARTCQGDVELVANLMISGKLTWSFIRNNRNTGSVEVNQIEKIVKDFNMEKVFDTVDEDVEFLEITGYLP